MSQDKEIFLTLLIFLFLGVLIIGFVTYFSDSLKREVLPSVQPPALEKPLSQWAQEIKEVYGRVKEIQKDFFLVQSYNPTLVEFYEPIEIKVFSTPETKVNRFQRKDGEFFEQELSFSEIKQGDEVAVIGKKSLISEDEFLAEHIIIRR